MSQRSQSESQPHTLFSRPNQQSGQQADHPVGHPLGLAKTDGSTKLAIGGRRPNTNGKPGVPALHSVLQSALDSLDVDLDDELIRYRRHMDKMARSKSSLSSSTQDSSSKHSWLQQFVPGASLAIASTSSPTPRTNSLVYASDESPEDRTLTPHDVPPQDYLESSEELIRSLDELDDHSIDEDNADSSQDASFLASLLTPLGIGSVLLLVLSSATLGYAIVNPSVLGWGDRQSNESASSSGVSASTPSSGIAPDLSAGEFAELDLHNLSALPRQQQMPTTTEQPNDNDAEAQATNPDPTDDPVSQPSQVQPLPPTASDPQPMAIAPAQPRGTSPVPIAPAPAAPQPPADQPSTPAPSQAPASRPAPSSLPLAPNTASQSSSASDSTTANDTSSAVIASTPTSEEGYVYVVTPYTGDRSLEEAQQAVSGAYVRNFPQGAQVQLGAFSSADRAQSLVQELNSQGIPAQVYDR